MTLAASPDSQPRISATHHGPLRVGIGGPVGSGKTALVEALCKRLRDNYDSHARKGGIKYRYYLSSALLQGMADGAGSVCRVPATEIEALGA